jgi:hypothetical protein
MIERNRPAETHNDRPVPMVERAWDRIARPTSHLACEPQQPRPIGLVDQPVAVPRHIQQ